jgi:3-oxoacyl-[acyl-carrier protein] reductase
MNLSEVNILITGGASGLGKTMATQLAGKAANVIVVDRNAEALEQLMAECPNIKCYTAELTDYEAVQAVTETIFKDFGKVNVLVNNAGIIHSEPLINILSREDTKHSLENWRRTIDINLNAVYYVTVNVVEKMVRTRSKGVIINISSISSYGNMGQSAYSATKAALNALTVTWSKELGMFGIRCVAIAPGFIDTPSTRASLTEAKITSYKNATPIRRLGNTDELVNAVEFIITNDFYNGTILNLDGGLKL